MVNRQTMTDQARCHREDVYLHALDQCSRVAREEILVASDALQHVHRIGVDLKSAVEAAARRAPRDGAAVENARLRLQELDVRLGKTLAASLASGEAALGRQRAALDRFTVTLFGRTMAGKSTIREALTGGDGGTIGKGAQRTTRDVREYEWNYLRVIDTPGIGAYEGEEDRLSAMAVIEETDLVLFLVSSDGLQEASFEGMRALRDQNKPLVFVLNVKRDLQRPVNLRRFLKDPGTVFNDAELRGHCARIKQLAGKELGMRDVRIVPIHAQAAFLATRPEHKDDADLLFERSGLRMLFEELRRQVSERGRVRRVQTIVDGMQTTLLDLQQDLTAQAKSLRQSARYLGDKFGELDVWMSGFVRATEAAAIAQASQLVQPLRTSVSAFIDENIERKDVGARWTQQVQALGIEEQLKRRQQTVLDELNARLTEFSREMSVERKLIDQFKAARPSQFDPWDVKRTLRWTSAAAGALGGVALVASWVGTSNFWNPVGWVAGTVSVVALGLSWCFGDREKKLQGQKATATVQLRDSIDLLEREIASVLIAWIRGTISGRLLRAIRRDTARLYDGMQDISGLLDEGSRKVGGIVDTLNRRLLLRVGGFVGFPIDEAQMTRIIRDPGLLTKFLWRGSKGEVAFCKAVGDVIGERVDGIPDGPIEHKVAWSLRPATVAPESVSIAAQTAVVRVPRHDMGRAIGREGSNVSVASRLMRIRIRIVGED